MYIFYVELPTDSFKLSICSAFFGVAVTFYGHLLNVVRDVYITARSFVTQVQNLVIVVRQSKGIPTRRGKG
ncbi:E3 ubiquitin-protein ligase hrd1 [Tulasnella sp. JGI-2019a]|nr:E3 ubiquitin-protein ligase hrd1 [Tulasnella sp. JGI-2019a]